MLDDTYGNDGLPRRTRMTLFRSGLIQRLRLLRMFSRTYVGYSIACAVVWASIWLSATIGRAVYPPPKPRRPAA